MSSEQNATPKELRKKGYTHTHTHTHTHRPAMDLLLACAHKCTISTATNNDSQQNQKPKCHRSAHKAHKVHKAHKAHKTLGGGEEPKGNTRKESKTAQNNHKSNKPATFIAITQPHKKKKNQQDHKNTWMQASKASNCTGHERSLAHLLFNAETLAAVGD